MGTNISFHHVRIIKTNLLPANVIISFFKMRFNTETRKKAVSELL